MFPTPITKIEYRLNDPKKNYPALYHLENIPVLEIYSRRNTDYFILDRKVYEQISSLIEENCMVVYLQECLDEIPFEKETTHNQLGIELRLYNERAGHPMIDFLFCQNHEELSPYLHTTYVLLQGEEYEVISSETDQDRKTFVTYLRKTASS